MDEMDWALVKVKGDITLLVTGMAGEHVTSTVIQPADGIIYPLNSKACY